MNTLDTFLRWIEKRGGARMIHRVPDGETKPAPYLERYYLVKTPFCELMIHRFHQGDRGDLHDHPWPSFGWIIRHGYREHLKCPDGQIRVFERRRGDFGARNALALHKVELRKGEAGKVLTLFGTGKRYRDWGFDVPGEGWIDQTTYSQRENNPDIDSGGYHYKGWIFPRRITVR